MRDNLQCFVGFLVVLIGVLTLFVWRVETKLRRIKMETKEREALRHGIGIVERCLAEMRSAMNAGDFQRAWAEWEDIGKAVNMIRKGGTDGKH